MDLLENHVKSAKASLDDYRKSILSGDIVDARLFSNDSDQSNNDTKVISNTTPRKPGREVDLLQRISLF